MTPAEFDCFAEDYEAHLAGSAHLAGEAPAYFARYKIQDVAQICAARPPRTILDFGAGIGSSVPFWRAAFPDADLTCLDVSRQSLDVARRRHPGAADYCAFDGVTIPFPARRFDLAFAACVFHHIDPPNHERLLAELRRVLTDDGRLFVFEHNPINPVTRYAVSRCPLDANAVLIRAGTMRSRLLGAGFSSVSTAYRLFFPGALRWLRPFEKMLAALPLGAQYRIAAAK